MGKGQYLGEFELYIMAATARLGAANNDAYGLTIRREIETRAGRGVAIGAVYATLGRLEEKRLVAFSISEPRPVPGGRSRKHVHLTAAGRRALAQSTAMLTRMLPGLAPAPKKP